MQRSDAEALVDRVYAARIRGDVDAVMALVTPDVKLQLIGSPDHSKVAFSTEGAADVRQALKALVDNFEFANFQRLTLLVDGDKIAHHCRIDVRRPKGGKAVTTELMDFWTIRDGKIASIKQACDTAMAHAMMTAA